MVLHTARPVLFRRQFAGLRYALEHTYLLALGSPVSIRHKRVYLVALRILQSVQLVAHVPFQILFRRCTLPFTKYVVDGKVLLRLVLEKHMDIPAHTGRIVQIRKRLVEYEHVIQQLRVVEVYIRPLGIQYRVG